MKSPAYWPCGIRSTTENELPGTYSTGLTDRLRAHLARRYPHMPAKAPDESVAAGNPAGVTLDPRNMSFHQGWSSS